VLKIPNDREIRNKNFLFLDNKEMLNPNLKIMKKFTLEKGLFVVLMAFLFTSCNPITLTSWTNPKENEKIENVVVWAMFDKLEYQKPFEQYASNYFNSKGLKAIQSLTFIPPGHKCELSELESKFDSLGVDGILIVTYKGTDKSESYVQPTTMVYPDYYYNYYNYYSWGYPMYAPGYNVVTSGGYWVTTSTVNLKANLYHNTDNGLLWTADITITDPNYVDEVSYNIASDIYADWQKNGLLKFAGK